MENRQLLPTALEPGKLRSSRPTVQCRLSPVQDDFGVLCPHGWSTPSRPHREEHPILSSRGGAPHPIFTYWSTPSCPHRVEHPIPFTQVEHPIPAGRVAGAPAQSLIQETQSLHKGARMTWSLSEAPPPPTSFTACEVPLSGVWKRYSSHG